MREAEWGEHRRKGCCEGDAAWEGRYVEMDFGWTHPLAALSCAKSATTPEHTHFNSYLRHRKMEDALLRSDR